MTKPDQFVFTDQSVPTGYDELLAPVLFTPWAEALVEQLAPSRGIRALDVATGPGTVARVLARRLGPGGRISAADSSPAMIARAESKGPVEGGAPIAYTVSPAAPLPFPDHAFDLATCQQGLQFFPDGAAALAEMRRVLIPGSRLGVSVWCMPEQCAPFYAFQQALYEAGQREIAELMKVPFPRWTDDDLAARAREVGFRDVAVVVKTRDLVFEGGLPAALAAFRGTPIGPLLKALPAEAQRAIEAAADRTFASLRTGGAIRGPMSSWVMIATA